MRVAPVRYRDAVENVFAKLAGAVGVYRGRGDGPESGPFLARIEVRAAVRARCLTLDYEATSDRNGLQHIEHTILTPGDDGRLELHVACLELPGVVRYTESIPGEFVTYDGPLKGRIVIGIPRPGHLTYSWWWSRDDHEPKEQSRAEVSFAG